MHPFRRLTLTRGSLGAFALAGGLLVTQSLAPARTRASQIIMGITGSTQMYTLGALLSHQYGGGRANLRIITTPSSSQGGFDSTCQNSSQIGMSDAYIQDFQLREQGCDTMINVPVAISAVAVIYNLPGGVLNKRTADQFTLVNPVRLTPAALADIYLGKVTTWNDPEIKRLNPRLSLPAHRIQPFYSAEPGGSGFVFNQWLARSVPKWNSSVGEPINSLQPAWPTAAGSGQPSSGTMISAVQSTPYSLGFAGFDYAISNHVQAAALQNASGAFLTPSLNGLSVAIGNAINRQLPGGAGIPIDFRASFVNVAGRDAYNPACFEFFDVRGDLRQAFLNPDARQTVKGFMQWSVSDNGGQAYIEQIEFRKTGHANMRELAHGFVPVPEALRQAIRTKVNSIAL